MAEPDADTIDYGSARGVDHSWCRLCGAVVRNEATHTAWHRSLYPAFLAAGEAQAHKETVAAIAEAAEDAGVPYGEAVERIRRHVFAMVEIEIGKGSLP